MDEMDYEMQHPEQPQPTQTQPSQPGSGCPVWRPDHGAVLPTPFSHNTSMASATNSNGHPSRGTSAQLRFDPVHNLNSAWDPMPAGQTLAPQWPSMGPFLPSPSSLAPLQYPRRLQTAASESTTQPGGSSNNNNATIPPGLILPPHPPLPLHHFRDSFPPHPSLYRTLPSHIPAPPNPPSAPAMDSREAVNMFAPQRLWEYGHRPANQSVAAIQAHSMATAGHGPPASQSQAPVTSRSSTASHDAEPLSPSRANHSSASSTTVSPRRPGPSLQNAQRPSLFGGDAPGRF
jgi:hypothetical protein